jgi:membrane-bound lytic murein transglycosylase D
VVRKLDANDVYDLATAREAALQVLPVLKEFEETAPYAAWLETRLAYVEVARTLKTVAVTELEPPKPGAPKVPSPPLPPPTPQAQRKAWDTWLAGRPASPAVESWVRKLKPVFREVGVPAELVWLAEVESSFNPNAKSPVGAAGLYQLMPATARGLGLSTWPFDDRLEGEDNARAAAKYLRQLYGRFGDWRLALAAYNAGEGRVGRLLERSKEKSFAGIAGRLPAETQLYVPRFEATLRRREGVALGSIGRPRG